MPMLIAWLPKIVVFIIIFWLVSKFWDRWDKDDELKKLQTKKAEIDLLPEEERKKALREFSKQRKAIEVKVKEKKQAKQYSPVIFALVIVAIFVVIYLWIATA